MKDRIRCPELWSRIATAGEAASKIKNGMNVAMGGYSQAGYPKAVPGELVRRRKSGEELSINLITGANVAALDGLLADAGVISRRVPMCAHRVLAGQINSGRVHYVEQQMNKMPGLLERGVFGEIDIAVVEALGITEEGHIVPTSSVGMLPNLLSAAREIIVEINMAQPAELEGMHDIYIPGARPGRQPIPLVSAGQKIGDPHVKVDRNKIICIVESDELDATDSAPRGNDMTNRIAAYLFELLEHEQRESWGSRLPPFQTGFGAMAASVTEALQESSFSNIQFFCGGTGESVLRLIASGKATEVSTGGIEMTDGSLEIIRSHPQIREHCVIRNGEITNNAEIIGRLGITALNSAIEVDIYGNANSSHIGGSRVVNGLGGGANFAQNAGLSVMLLPSTGKKGCISNIVPMVSHQDISEHDIDVIITENGIADLRGLDDVERARSVIKNCAAEGYREQLEFYLDRALQVCGGHHPQLPDEAFGWHRRLKKTGSMMM